MIEHVEVIACGVALQAAQRIDTAAALKVIQCRRQGGDRGGQRIAAGQLRVVAQSAQQNRPRIGDFPGDDAADDSHARRRVIRTAILLAAEQYVARGEPAHAGEERSALGEK